MDAVQTSEPLTDRELEAIIKAEVADAVSYIATELGPERAESLQYYRGDKLGDEQEGRSKVVSRDVRDGVRQILPSLMRVFCGSERAVEYEPRSAEDVAVAEQATDYVNYVLFQDNPGFHVLYSAFKDALYQKAGIIKYWWDDSREVTYHSFTDLDDAALGAVVQDEGVEVVDVSSRFDPDALPRALAAGIEPPMLHDANVRRTRKRGRVRVMELAPEEFLISRNARSIDEARYVGHRALLTVGELVALGYDAGFLSDNISTSDFFEDSEDAIERYEREGGVWPDIGVNPDARRVLYVESYVRVDMDGDDIPELRKVCTIGESYSVVANDPVPERPFAAFCADPEPHKFFGSDVADQTKDIQRIKTAVWRRSLDSLAQAIYPRTAIVNGQVNVADALNTEMGALIRMTQPGMVQPFVMPFVGKEAFPMLEYLDREKDRRVGVHNMALEADALQSTTKAAVNAQVEAAKQQLELIARVFAEGGMKRLFSGLLRLVVTHQDKARMVRLRNEWVQVDPRAWDASMDVVVNVGLGHGLAEDRMMVLREVLTIQREILTQLGPQNPLVGFGQVRNTLGKLLENSGYKDTAQFFNPLQIDWKPPPAPPPPPDPAELIAQAEVQKAQVDAQESAAKLDLERDKLMADVLLRAAEIEAKYNTSVDVARIRASIEQNKIELARGRDRTGA